MGFFNRAFVNSVIANSNSKEHVYEFPVTKLTALATTQAHILKKC